jgi:hypothetical protein
MAMLIAVALCPLFLDAQRRQEFPFHSSLYTIHSILSTRCPFMKEYFLYMFLYSFHKDFSPISRYPDEMVFGIIKHEISKKCTCYLQNGIPSRLDTEISPDRNLVFYVAQLKTPSIFSNSSFVNNPLVI